MAKKSFITSIIFLSALLLSHEHLTLAVDEDWKGPADSSQVGLGAMTGLGKIYDNSGIAFVGLLSKKILNRGFVPDINDAVWIEAELGPVMISGTTAWLYGAHIRWDFDQNATWRFFALGGVGGHVVTLPGSITSQTAFAPRLGVGAFWKMTDLIHWRGEVSHNLISVGVQLPL